MLYVDVIAYSFMLFKQTSTNEIRGRPTTHHIAFYILKCYSFDEIETMTHDKQR